MGHTRSVYEKYREKLKRMMQEQEYYFGGAEVEEFYKYAISRFHKDILSLFRYDRFCLEYGVDLENIYLSTNGRLNDIFEGLASTYIEGEELNEQIRRFKEMAYIKCFSETPINNLMWAHYANDYSGYCLKYDLSLLDEDNICVQRMMPVIYSKERRNCMEIGSMADCLNGVNDEDWITDAYGLFYIKANYWRYEKEWRCVLLKNEVDINKNEKVIKLPFDCIKTIYLGPRTEKNNIDSIVTSVKQYEQRNNRKIEIKQIVLDAYSYELKIIDKHF